MVRYPCVYILASRRNGTLYVGVTSNLAQRIWQHRNADPKSFARRYGVMSLVYVETHDTVETAIVREKQIKEWRRHWKLHLIEQQNPGWRDLFEDLNR